MTGSTSLFNKVIENESITIDQNDPLDKNRIWLSVSISKRETQYVRLTPNQWAAILPTLIKAVGSLRTLTSFLQEDQK